MRIEEGDICETQTPKIQLIHQIYQFSLLQLANTIIVAVPLALAISSTCRPFIVLSKIPIPCCSVIQSQKQI